MKKLFVFATLLLATVTGAFAQAPHSKGTPEERAKRMGDIWQKKLGLSDDEKAKFVNAKTAQINKIQELHKTKPVDKVAVQSAKTDFDNSVKAAFTPEHYDAWKKTREEMKAKHQEHKAGKGEKAKGPKGGKKEMKPKGKKAPEKSESEESEHDEDELENQ